MNSFAARRFVFVLAVVASVSGPSAARAYTLTTLYSFCQKPNCADGATPRSQPVMDASGNLYLTTGIGGRFNAGTVIELAKKHKGRWKEKVLRSFSNQKDGASPTSGVIMDVSGNLYGTTSQGGVGGGVVYELSPIGKNGWTIKVLYQFCAADSSCPDGISPEAKLAYAGAAAGAAYDGVSPLYGTTANAGLGLIAGTVFQLTPSSRNWSETTIYQFCSTTDCKDGEEPRGEVIVDGFGDLLGMTWFGGRSSPPGGVVFKLEPNKSNWIETLLYNFCRRSRCADGSLPVAGLVEDALGNVVGTTSGGGESSSQCSQFFGVADCGAVFEIDPAGHEEVLYSFCAQSSCADGALPESTLVSDRSGNLIGTTFYGGTGAAWDSGRAGSGTVFAENGKNHAVLYSFCTQTNCLDGADPEAAVFVDAAGNIYGTTTAGGANGMGTVFELSP